MAKDWKLLKMAFCGVFLSLSGCMANITTHYQGRKYLHEKDAKLHSQASSKPSAMFSLPRRLPKINQTIYTTQKFKNYQVSQVQFHSVGRNGQPGNTMTAAYYRSLLPGPKKLFIVLPIFGASTYPSTAISHGMLYAGKGQVDVVRVLGRRPLMRIENLEEAKTPAEFRSLLKELAGRIRNTIIDTKVLINWAVKQRRAPYTNIDIIGFSKSVVLAGLVARSDPKITGAIYVMGGDSPTSMLFNCHYYEIRENITKRFNWSGAKLYSVIRTYMEPYNIASYQARLSPQHVLIIDSHYDECVPKESRDELWRAAGKPARISFLYGHKMSFGSMTMAGMYYMRFKIYRFVVKNNSSLYPICPPHYSCPY